MMATKNVWAARAMQLAIGLSILGSVVQPGRAASPAPRQSLAMQAQKACRNIVLHGLDARGSAIGCYQRQMAEASRRLAAAGAPARLASTRP